MKKIAVIVFTFLPFLICGQSFELVKTFIGHTSGVETVVYAPDGKSIISGDMDGNIFFWDISTARINKIIKAHKDEVSQISFSSSGKLMCTSSYDGTVKVWDLIKAEQIVNINSPNILHNPKYNKVTSAIFSPDDKFIYFGNTGGSLYKFNIALDSIPKLVFHDHYFITDAQLSLDRSYIVFTSGKSIKFLNPTKDNIIQEVGVCDEFTNNIAFTPNDNNIIVTWCEDGTINYWNIKKNMLISSIKAGDEGYSRIDFSKNGKYLISGNSGNNARIWDPVTKSLIAELKGHQGIIKAVKFSSDSKFILTASRDATIKLWEVIDIQKSDSAINPKIHFKNDNIPVSIDNRPVNKQEDIIVKNKDIEFFVWDNDIVDGDSISLNINGTWVLENYGLTKAKKSVKISLRPNTNNYLILYAINLGTIPPNTAAISIKDGNQEKTLTLKSDLKNCGAINFIYKE